MEQSKFLELLQLNVNDKVEKKPTGNNKSLSYLSWAWAWAEFKKVYDDATYEIMKNTNNLPYFVDELGAMVYTKVTAGGITYEMWLPVMDGANKAMKLTPYEIKTKYGTTSVKAFDMFDVNKTVMRCLVKNLAMFGLGLYIYAGEDLPELPDDDTVVETTKVEQKPVAKVEQKAPTQPTKETEPTQDDLDAINFVKTMIDNCNDLAGCNDMLENPIVQKWVSWNQHELAYYLKKRAEQFNGVYDKTTKQYIEKV